MSLTYRFTVPGPPMPKARPRIRRGQPRPYPPKATTRFEERVRLCALQAGVKPIDGPVGLVVRAFWEWPRSAQRKRRPRLCTWRAAKPDADNVLKAVADALNRIAYVDDAQVSLAQVAKYRGNQGEEARVDVTVFRLEE